MTEISSQAAPAPEPLFDGDERTDELSQFIADTCYCLCNTDKALAIYRKVMALATPPKGASYVAPPPGESGLFPGRPPIHQQSEQPAPAEAPEPWTDAKLRGIASDYFREAKDWPAAMLCLRHLLMEQRAAAPAEAGSAPAKCRMCNGEGTLYSARPFRDDPYFEESRPCEACNGTGTAATPEIAR